MDRRRNSGSIPKLIKTRTIKYNTWFIVSSLNRTLDGERYRYYCDTGNWVLNRNNKNLKTFESEKAAESIIDMLLIEDSSLKNVIYTVYGPVRIPLE